MNTQRDQAGKIRAGRGRTRKNVDEWNEDEREPAQEDPTARYIREVGAKPPLSVQEERSLALKMETAQKLLVIQKDLSERLKKDPKPEQIAEVALDEILENTDLIDALGRKAGIHPGPKTLWDIITHPRTDRRSIAEIGRAMGSEEEILPFQADIDDILNNPEISKRTKEKIRGMLTSEQTYRNRVLNNPEVRAGIDGPFQKQEITDLANETGREEERVRQGIITLSLGARIIPTYNLQETEEQKTLEDHLRDIADQGRAARETLVLSNERLVLSIAKRYTRHGIDLTDLSQEGNLGLMKAAEKFEHRRGWKFGTYATWWIKQAVSRAVYKQARTVRLPAHWVESIRKIDRAGSSLLQTLGRDALDHEIADLTGIPEKKVKEAKRIAHATLSLDEEDKNSNRTLLDSLQYTEEAQESSEEKENTYRNLQKDLKEALKILDKIERQVIILRYGLELEWQEKPFGEGGKAPEPRKNDGMTLEQISQRVGISKEKVRVTEVRAIKKLMESQKRGTLRQYHESISELKAQ